MRVLDHLRKSTLVGSDRSDRDLEEMLRALVNRAGFYVLSLCLVLCANSSIAGTTYIHTDYLGSTVAESNAAGVVTERYYFKPYGASVGSGSEDEPAYTGHVFDGDLGITYMQQRYYDQVIGRFYSNDPADWQEHKYRNNTTHGFNRYSYAINNPLKFVDPDGRAICGGWCVFGIGIGVGYLIDKGIEAVRGTESPAAQTAANATIGGAVSTTLPTETKPRVGVAGGGKSKDATSIASKINHDVARKTGITLKTRNRITALLRKIPWIGTALGVGQLADAVHTRVTNNSDSNESGEQSSEKSDSGDTGRSLEQVHNGNNVTGAQKVDPCFVGTC